MRNIDDPIEVVCNVDDRYARQCAVMFTSLLENNPDDMIIIHVVTTYLMPANRVLLSDIVQRKYGCRLVMHKVDDELLKSCPVRRGDYVSVTAYLRCFLPAILPLSIHKVLYLDSDLLVLGNIRPLWDVDLTDKALAAVEDSSSGNQETLVRLRLPDNYTYFNSGVMVMNLDYWRENKILKRLMLYLDGFHERIRENDQDLLNVCLWKNRVLLPLRWNMQGGFLKNRPGCRRYALARAREEIRRTVIAHFVGRKKPWHNNCANPFASEYNRYLDMTEFADHRPAKAKINPLFGMVHHVMARLGIGGYYRHRSIEAYGFTAR